MNQAQKIFKSNTSFESCELAARNECVSYDDTEEAGVCIYIFEDGSKLKRQIMASACEDDSYIKVVT